MTGARAPRISLALAIHDHQPVGNFGWVIADAYDHAYEPLLGALERHPTIRIALHLTGPLLDWIAAERPEFIERLRVLVERDQLEIMGGGWAEPVLIALPDRDRHGQLVRMADEVERLFGRRPSGAWLAERVWEPDLPVSIAGAGYRWTILDDAHFRAASVPEDALWGAYMTEDQGSLLTVFGTEQGLRYRIPFGEVDDVIEHLRAHATPDGSRLGVMGDDGEKFGVWPHTYEHCWGKTRWIDRFFEALEANEDWLTTLTPSDWLVDHPPIGRVYVPTGSYAEMGEWSLPPDEARVFGPLLRRAVEEGRPEARFLRGGTWRAFASKYRELGDLRAQMLRASAAVAALDGREGGLHAAALDHLYRGQANDAYWHGLFGGVYLADLRLAVAHHLIAAEDLADIATRGHSTASATGSARLSSGQLDLDLDGIDEVRLVGPGEVVIVDPREGGGIGAWDVRAVRHALGAVLRRRPEAYHEKLLAEEAPQPPDESSKPLGGPSHGAAGEAAKAVVTAKEAGLAATLHYDAWERRSGLVHLFPSAVTPDDVATASARGLVHPDQPCGIVEQDDDHVRLERDAIDATASLDAGIATTIEVGGDRRSPTLGFALELTNRSGTSLDTRLGVTWDVMLLGGGSNPAAYYEIGGERFSHDSRGSATAIASLAAGNDQIGLRISTAVEPAADAWWSSIDTVSNSEGGFERIHQGSALLLSWPVSIGPGESFRARVDHVVSTSHDAAADAMQDARQVSKR